MVVTFPPKNFLLALPISCNYSPSLSLSAFQLWIVKEKKSVTMPYKFTCLSKDFYACRTGNTAILRSNETQWQNSEIDLRMSACAKYFKLIRIYITTIIVGACWKDIGEKKSNTLNHIILFPFCFW